MRTTSFLSCCFLLSLYIYIYIFKKNYESCFLVHLSVLLCSSMVDVALCCCQIFGCEAGAVIAHDLWCYLVVERGVGVFGCHRLLRATTKMMAVAAGV